MLLQFGTYIYTLRRATINKESFNFSLLSTYFRVLTILIRIFIAMLTYATSSLGGVQEDIQGTQATTMKIILPI